MNTRQLIVLGMCALATACGGDRASRAAPWVDEATQPDAGLAGASSSSAQAKELCADGAGKLGPEPERLQWKRGDAVNNDLMAALELGADEVCNELGTQACVDAHRVPLGRSDAYGAALYVPVARPLATTSIATERVVLSACTRRAELDSQGSPKVFRQVDLHADTLDVEDSAVADSLRAELNGLYRRLLGREATGAEQELALALARGPDGSNGASGSSGSSGSSGKALSGRDFAKLACFAVATTTEFTLY